MKRSEINSYIQKAKNRLKEFNVSLPWFGYLTLDGWKEIKNEIKLIKDSMLGWDVTDFDSGDFATTGAVLFTVRNGDINDKQNRRPYCEKYIILDDETEQEIPFHYHIDKTEDIINRAGGTLVIEAYYKSSDGGLDANTPVKVFMDGVYKTFQAGEKIEVRPGNSITLEPFMYHRFTAKKGDGMLIVGEVSKVNDDNNDNVFLNPLERFSAIVEDEPAIHPLVNEYNNL
ncbi:MAG: D-lyxose/D-mannose family sugar isomerase [Clostridiales bacterium]|nr:D-lyxose/D-mannose family sugar isomerase [Clostridiales bacterium]